MDFLEESSRFSSVCSVSLRNLSSSSSAFFSANQSPFFSPRSPRCQASTRTNTPWDHSSNNKTVFDSSKSLPEIQEPKSLTNVKLSSTSNVLLMPAESTSNDDHKSDDVSPSAARYREKQKKLQRFYLTSFNTNPIFPSNRLRCSDVYISFYSRKPLLLRFTNWLRAELEAQGVSCFVTDRKCFHNSRSQGIVEKAMDACSYGVIILTRKSFRNSYTIEEVLFFANKKNLVPIYFDLGPDDCLVRDIIERRGEMWEKYGGELWLLYGGLEKEWKDAINSLSRVVDNWKLDAHDGNWRDCILRTVTLLALRLGRRNVVDRITRWSEKAATEEFSFPRNENFIGRKKELSELEFMLFGDVSSDVERDYIEIKATRLRRKNMTIGWGRREHQQSNGGGRRKGKEPVVWKESEKEIEMMQKPKNNNHGERRHGKGKDPVVWKESEKEIKMMQKPKNNNHGERRHGKGKEPVVWKESEKEIEMMQKPKNNNHGERRHGKGKEPVVWKESENEIQMMQKPKNNNHGERRHGKRKRSTKIVYGKGIACVTGESGIGKTELLLEFAYRFHQRYKSVLWVGGESRYIRQNYLNLWPFLEVEVGVENVSEKNRMIKSFEEQEESSITRIRKELMRNIPFLIVIDNLENEKDWFDHKLIMDLLPRFGGETHILISTRLSRVMNLEPLKLSFLSGMEAMLLMQGNVVNFPMTEIDALRVIEERLGRLTLGISIVGAILSEIPITPSRLLDTINQMPLRDMSGRNYFLLQLFEVCFSIFDHSDGPRSLATKMVLASGWFSPSPVPVSLLAIAAHKINDKHCHRRRANLKKLFRVLTSCGLTRSYVRKSEAEGSSILVRFNIARRCTKEGHIQFNDIVRLYSRMRGDSFVAQAMVQSVVSRASISLHSEQIWGACFLLFGFGNDPIVVELKVSELLFLVKEMVLPLAIKSFVTFSRCRAALELLRLCTNALEVVDEAFVTPVESWLYKSLCWKRIQTTAQLNPNVWQELALSRATVLETRAKLMVRGGQFDIGDDLIRKAIFIRTSVCGEDHPGTLASRETLSKLTRRLANVQMHTTTSQ